MPIPAARLLGGFGLRRPPCTRPGLSGGAVPVICACFGRMMANWTGTTGNDTANGSNGADNMSAGAGNDVAYGGEGKDTIYGGDGNDTVYGGNDNDFTYGDAGNDVLYGGAGIDVQYGGSGDDTIDGGAQYDVSYGGGGNDVMYGDDQNYDDFFGGTGNDTIYAGDSNDDWAWGEDGNDVIHMGDGFDSAFGGAGDDTLYGDGGADTVAGDAGNDQVFGGAGNDSLDGGAGKDSVYGGSGNDSATLGDGDDTFGDWSTEGGNDTVYGGAGNDQIIGGGENDNLYGGDGNDTLSGGIGADTIYGGAGNDRLVVTEDHQTDTFDAGENAGDFDEIAFYNWQTAQSITVTFSGTDAGIYSYNGGGATGNFTGVEGISGTNYADSLNASASSGAQTIAGNGGDDTVLGGSGNSTIYGGDGADQLHGGAGSELLTGDAGADTITGGAGNDSLYGGDGHDSVSGGAGNDALYGGTGDDRLFGDAGNDTLAGGDGNDALAGGTGDDTLDGGAGHDVLLGDAGNDSLSGGDGDDRLFGGDGSDTLLGGAGNDHLQGGKDSDRLTGGAGNDVFDLVHAGGGDRITDFNTGLSDGHTADQLDVSDLRNPDGTSVHPWDVIVSDDGHGNALLTFPQGESVVLEGVSPSQASSSGMLHAMGVPCFAAGTRILTPQGARVVESLAVGDLVITAQGSAVPVLWHGQRHLNASTLQQCPELRPIRLAPMAIGNQRSLLLSPQHAVLVRRGDQQHLIRARSLAAFDPRAHVVKSIKSIDYHHILLPRHALIFAEGAAVESFYPGKMALRALSSGDRYSLARVILAQHSVSPRPTGPARLQDVYGPRCQPVLSHRDAADWLKNTTNYRALNVPAPQLLAN